jgi:hypothetical protein
LRIFTLTFLNKLKIKPIIKVNSKLLEETEGACEQNEYRKNPKTNVTLPAERTKLNRTSNEEMGGKYETTTGHLTQHLTGRR